MKKIKLLITTGLLTAAFCVVQAQEVGVGTETPNSTLHVQGSFATAITTTATNLTLDDSHQVVLVSSSLNRTITLPSAIGIAGRKYSIKKIGSGNVTISPQAGQFIEGAGSFIVFGSNAFITIVSDGSDWWVLVRD